MRCAVKRGTRKQRRRGAALYIAVLSTALIVSLLGMAGLLVVRIERRQAACANNVLLARANARSAVELALRLLANDPDWRTNYTSGTETAMQSLGPNATGTLSWILEDSDNSLLDADTELRLKGIGRVGDTVQVSSVEISFGAISCLEVAICSNGPITFWSSSTTSTGHVISSNSSVETNSGTVVNSNVEAVGAITGTGYVGTTTTPVPERVLPTGPDLDYYIANGTAISFTAIPKIAGKRTLEGVVLSPGNNPYGATDPAGIYVIDCGGATFQIRDSRIIATLVVINPAATSIIEDGISWEPAVANYPALLVLGSKMSFATHNLSLDEAVCGVNFNPAGSPYLGVTDGDQTDSYPSVIKGLVYVAGDAVVTANHPQIDGVLVTGDEFKVNSDESVTVTYDPLYLSSPPPGFVDDEFSAKHGSWLCDTAP